MTTAPTPAQTSASPSDMERLFLYMRDFEMAYLSGEWSVLDPHFCDDARHGIDGGALPLGIGGSGRDAIVAGLRGGVDAALAVCDSGFSIDTVAFGIASQDREETRVQLGAFFHSFPDYAVTLEGFATSPGMVTCWGRARMTFGGDFLGYRSTGRRADLPIFCVFETAGGAIASERFFFDLAALCEQIGVPVAEFSAGLHSLREQGMAA